jgi:hypothetical protein
MVRDEKFEMHKIDQEFTEFYRILPVSGICCGGVIYLFFTVLSFSLRGKVMDQ